MTKAHAYAHKYRGRTLANQCSPATRTDQGIIRLIRKIRERGMASGPDEIRRLIHEDEAKQKGAR